MLLPEARLDTLVEQLNALPAADRKAILERLSPRERGAVRERLREANARPQSPYSPDIAERIAAGDKAPLTPVARAALARCASGGETRRAASLFDLVSQWWRLGGAG